MRGGGRFSAGSVAVRSGPSPIQGKRILHRPAERFDRELATHGYLRPGSIPPSRAWAKLAGRQELEVQWSAVTAHNSGKNRGYR